MSTGAETLAYAGERSPAGRGLRSFVLLPIAKRRLALPAEFVVELVAPSRLAIFPHRTPWILGVIVRRGRVVPICDTSVLFRQMPPGGEAAGSSSIQGRFLLIAEWRIGELRDWCAIPVSGECELASPDAEFEAWPESAGDSGCIAGLLNCRGERIEILDLGKLIESQAQPSAEDGSAGRKSSTEFTADEKAR